MNVKKRKGGKVPSYKEYSDAIEAGLEKVVAKLCPDKSLPSVTLATKVGSLKGSLIMAYQELETQKENAAHYKELYETAQKGLDELREIYELDN